MIEVVHQQVTYALDVGNIYLQEWAWRNGAWRKCSKDFREQKWWEDHPYDVITTSDVLVCWASNYLPGLIEWDDYGDLQLTFSVEDVRAAGWTLEHLYGMLVRMVLSVKRKKRLDAEPPWETEYTDAYGAKHRKYCYPAIKPLLGMLDRDYPSDIIHD